MAARTPGGGESKVLAVRVSRAMEVLGIGKTKLYDLIADGELETVKVGRRTLIVQASIDAFFERIRSPRRRRL
jgi:excisionase family DNA binding protein